MPVHSSLPLTYKPRKEFQLWHPKRGIRWSWILVFLILWGMVGFWKASNPRRPLPAHARYGFILDGQSPDGYRVASGLDWLRQGKIDTLIVSGVELGGGVYFSMIWVHNLPLVGKDKEHIVEMRSSCTSTMEEARMMDAFFRERKIDTAVVITSEFHVWRAASIFEKVSQGKIQWFFRGAPDARWDAPWGDREMFKAHLLEWTKRITWVLWEQWKPLDRQSPVKSHSLHGGEELGRMPPPNWKP